MACNSINKGINSKCSTSMGGIVEVAIANYNDVAIDFRGETGTVTDVREAITAEAIIGRDSWYKFSFRKGTSQMTSTLNIDDANGVNYVSTELQMLFGKMETEKRVALDKLSTSELVVVVKDSNGKYWLLGAVEPVTVSGGEGATGTARGDSNHYSITLVDNCPVFPLECDNGEFILNGAIY